MTAAHRRQELARQHLEATKVDLLKGSSQLDCYGKWTAHLVYRIIQSITYLQTRGVAPRAITILHQRAGHRIESRRVVRAQPEARRCVKGLQPISTGIRATGMTFKLALKVQSAFAPAEEEERDTNYRVKVKESGTRTRKQGLDRAKTCLRSHKVHPSKLLLFY